MLPFLVHLLLITNAPWYVTNPTLHKDVRIPQVRTVLQELTDTHRTAPQSHPNPLMAKQQAIAKTMDT